MLFKKEETFCLACENPLKGRTDKKYCDDYCRSTYNNSIKPASTKCVRNINNALLKNRRILQRFYSNSTAADKIINRENMLQEGFQFKYLTHTIPQAQQIPIYCCYDFGYKPLPDESYLIIQLQQHNDFLK